jgi:hypothetical protein
MGWEVNASIEKFYVYAVIFFSPSLSLSLSLDGLIWKLKEICE